MRTLVQTLIAGLLAATPLAADVIWDNYPNGYNHAVWHSSERNTVVNNSWMIDDFTLEVSEEIAGVQWVGAHSLDTPFSGADLLILDDDFQLVTELTNVEYTVQQLEIFQSKQIFEGTINFDEALVLPAGKYYLGTRLVGAAGVGRAYTVVAGDGPRGDGSALFRSPLFGIMNWTHTEDIPLGSGTAYDNAFRLLGVVPEPATLALLAISGVAALRRRR